ncbi:MAG: hypothetical protein KF832_11660 [Caldilineaceae bacterium]|nr:hypothetical protein [Caldilineaceae bacterium]
MEALPQRTQQVVESLTDNEALTDNLEDEAAQALLDWGIALGKTVVQSTANLDDTAAEEAIAPGLKATRRLLKVVNQHFAADHEPTTSRSMEPTTDQAGNDEENALRPLLRDIVQQVTLILGPTYQPPTEEQLTTFAAQFAKETPTPQALIQALRRFIEQPSEEAAPRGEPPRSEPEPIPEALPMAAQSPPIATPVSTVAPPSHAQPVAALSPWMKRLREQLRRLYQHPNKMD